MDQALEFSKRGGVEEIKRLGDCGRQNLWGRGRGLAGNWGRVHNVDADRPLEAEVATATGAVGRLRPL